MNSKDEKFSLTQFQKRLNRYGIQIMIQEIFTVKEIKRTPVDDTVTLFFIHSVVILSKMKFSLILSYISRQCASREILLHTYFFAIMVRQ